LKEELATDGKQKMIKTIGKQKEISPKDSTYNYQGKR
jgi:hypothetical protein